MKRYILILIILSSCTSNKFSDYKSIKKPITATPYFCSNTKYSIENEPLNGKYKKKYDHSIFYANFDNGYIIKDSYWYRKGGIFVNDKYDSNGNLILCTHYQNKKEKKSIKSYHNSSYLEYDSVKTFINNNLPYKSIFYIKGQDYHVNYKVTSGKINVETTIDEFKLSPDDISLNSISRLFFTKCPYNQFLFNSITKEYYDKVSINIKSAEGAKLYKYKLQVKDDKNSFYEEEPDY